VIAARRTPRDSRVDPRQPRPESLPASLTPHRTSHTPHAIPRHKILDPHRALAYAQVQSSTLTLTRTKKNQRKMSDSALVTIDIQGKLPLVASGKVRDLYAIDEDTLLFVASDRISAYDVVLENVSILTPPKKNQSIIKKI